MWARTVVDLLERHDSILRQTLLRILIQQEGFGSDLALLGGVLRGGGHGH